MADVNKAPTDTLLLAQWDGTKSFYPAQLTVGPAGGRHWDAWIESHRITRQSTPPLDWMPLPMQAAPIPVTPAPPVVVPSPPAPAPGALPPLPSTLQPIASPLDLIGPFVPVATVRALGPAFASCEDKFLTGAAKFAPEEKTGYEWYYYDRGRIYYAYYARSGDKQFLDRAHKAVLAYRTLGIEAVKYGTTDYWTFAPGLGVHFLLTGDAASALAIGRLGDSHAMPYYMDRLGDKTIGGVGLDPREHSRMLENFMWGHFTGAPSPKRMTYNPEKPSEEWGEVGGNDWAALMPVVVDGIMAAQSPDGHWGHTQRSPFMYGMLNDVLIDYYRFIKPDPRIVPAIKKNLDLMWASAWVPDKKAFLYDMADSKAEGGAAPDLNMMIVSAFGWIAKMTGDRSYIDKGDVIFQGGVEGAWFDGGKQWSQQYETGYRYLSWRAT